MISLFDLTRIEDQSNYRYVVEQVENAFKEFPIPQIATKKGTCVLDECLEFLLPDVNQIPDNLKKYHNLFQELIMDENISVISGSSVLEKMLFDNSGSRFEVNDIDIFISYPAIINKIKQNFESLLPSGEEITELFLRDFFGNHIFTPEYIMFLAIEYLKNNKEYLPEKALTHLNNYNMETDSLLTFDYLNGIIKTGSDFSSYGNMDFLHEPKIETYRSSFSFLPLNLIVTKKSKSDGRKIGVSLQEQSDELFSLIGHYGLPPLHLENIYFSFDFENLKLYWDFKEKTVKYVPLLYIEKLTSFYNNIIDNHKEDLPKMWYSHIQSNLNSNSVKNGIYGRRRSEWMEESFNNIINSPKYLFSGSLLEELVDRNRQTIDIIIRIFNAPDEVDGKIISNILYSLPVLSLERFYYKSFLPRVEKYNKKGFVFRDEFGLSFVVRFYRELKEYYIYKNPVLIKTESFAMLMKSEATSNYSANRPKELVLKNQSLVATKKHDKK